MHSVLLSTVCILKIQADQHQTAEIDKSYLQKHLSHLWRAPNFPTHIQHNTLTNTYRTHFHAHKCQKALLHLSWNWWLDYLWWKNCFSWQTAAQIFSDGGQYILRFLTWLRTAILQTEVCYCHATAFVNQITSPFWQMHDSCPFMLCKLRIQTFWDVTACERYEGTMFFQNVRNDPPKQNSTPQ